VRGCIRVSDAVWQGVVDCAHAGDSNTFSYTK
jgi:hypothetical protein